MGLFRLYWIPIALEAIQGAYVRYPASELLDILALESHRANAFVVGEDLGTVEGVVRSTLAERRVLTYRLVWFESGMPENYPSDSLAALNTHDLPTLAGVWTGSDLAARRKAGIDVNADAEVELHDRLVRASGAGADDSLSDVVTGAFKALAATPSRVVMATLDDVLGVEERPNIPGATAQQWANWSLALPVPIEELETHKGAKAVAETLSAGR